jgi:hypothetical protein
MKKLFTTLILFSAIVGGLSNIFAQTMNVNLINGNTDQYITSNIKTITFKGDTMNVNNTNATTGLEYLNNIRKITFSEVTSVPVIKDVASNELKIYPNPANNQVSIEYALNTSGVVEIKIYNTSGVLVKQIMKGNQQAGTYKYQWNIEDNDGGAIIDTGTYLCSLVINNKVYTNKILIIK